MRERKYFFDFGIIYFLMIKAGSITKGMFLLRKEGIFLVVDKEFFNPGKGAAVVRLKLKDLKSGHVVREVLKTDELVEEVAVEYRRFQFLYQNGDQFVFINPRNYEQFEVEEKVIGEGRVYLKEGKEYRVALYQGKVLAVIPPKKMVFKVEKTEEAVKGDTVTGATKPALLENGLTVKVPLFVKKGDKVVISTETGEYLGREN